MFRPTNNDIYIGLAIADADRARRERNRNRFQVEVKEKNFTPDEITVSTADGYIIIEGKHEEKTDKFGFVTRKFTRRCALPEDFVADPESLEFKMSSRGVMTVKAHRMMRRAVQAESSTSTPVTQTEENEDQAEEKKDQAEEMKDQAEEKKDQAEEKKDQTEEQKDQAESDK